MEFEPLDACEGNKGSKEIVVDFVDFLNLEWVSVFEGPLFNSGFFGIGKLKVGNIFRCKACGVFLPIFLICFFNLRVAMYFS